jgi:glutathione S-transferase
MITLHYHPGNASMAPHMLLREIGKPFALSLVDRANNAHKSAAYLKLNPNGSIPVLVDGELVLYETAAICMHLADSHPEAGLAPAPGTPERAQFYKWMVWLTNTLQARLMHYFYPERLLDGAGDEVIKALRAKAEADIGAMLVQLDAQVGASGGPWLLGEDFSAADAMAFMLCRWTRGFASKPAREYTHLAGYVQRMLARPAVQVALKAEGLVAPLV